MKKTVFFNWQHFHPSGMHWQDNHLPPTLLAGTHDLGMWWNIETS